jgi:acetylglutamate/LysW-gamma-L-alpha-aminoadipate kinase
MLVIIKIGGKVIEKNFSTILKDIKKVSLNNQLVLIHGGGAEVTAIASKMGKQQEFIVSPKGFRSRYTDKETIDIYKMVMIGRINSNLVTQLQSEGINSVGLSGMDGLSVRAKRKKRLIIIDAEGRKRVIDGGYTGQVSKVNPTLLEIVMKNGYLPVFSPIAVGEDFEPLNVDGDRMAANIAGALKADRLLLLTDTPGIMVNDQPLSNITTSKLKMLIPEIGYGMITKAYAATEALNLGVKQVTIFSGLEKSPLILSLRHNYGTVIRNE